MAPATTTTTWDQTYQELQSFVTAHGHCRVSDNHNKSLYDWCRRQRQQRQNHQLTNSQMDRLNAIQFDWHQSTNRTWKEWLDDLCQYKKEHGHCAVKYSELYKEKALGQWLHRQKKMCRTGKLLPYRRDALEKVGIVLNADVICPHVIWKQWLDLLRQYKIQHGHCLVKNREQYQGKALGHWINTQKTMHKLGKLTRDRRELLDMIGISWAVSSQTAWENWIALLCRYQQEHGHTNVPYKHKFQGKSLGYWTSTQRKEYKKGNLSQDRIKALEELGFQWTLGRSYANTKQRLLVMKSSNKFKTSKCLQISTRRSGVLKRTQDETKDVTSGSSGMCDEV